MAASKIEWTDKVWNPVTGCTKVSQGCKNCYAERQYERFNGHGSFKNVLLHPERLQQPLHWKKPSMIFVNSMSDLFHEDVPFEFINAVFRVMADCDHHIYQVLTKRPQRMLEFFEWEANQFIPWRPSDNVWIGVSVENQDTANERIPLLLQVPAAVRFLSCEPLLGPVDLQIPLCDVSDINWVIVGGESGPAARPMHPDWVRSLRDQCAVARVPFFFKQWGEWTDEYPQGLSLKNRKQTYQFGKTFYKVGKHASGNLLDGEQYLQFPKAKFQTKNLIHANIKN